MQNNKLEEATMLALQGKLNESKEGNKAGICPACGKPITQYGEIYWDDEGIGQEFTCQNCKAKGTEYYNTTFDYTELENENLDEGCKKTEASRMDKLQGIVNRHNQDTTNAETNYMNDINNLYSFVMQYQDRINEDIKLYLYAAENKLMPETKLGDSWWYADGLSHHIGFINNRYFRGALGILGGGICGDVGVVYNQDKLYLYAEDSHRIVAELTDTALTTKDIGVSTETLSGFAEYCNSFKQNLLPFLDKFEKYIDEEIQ